MSKVDLFHGDCLELMKDIPDGSVDCIITDPPYMSAMQHNGKMTDFSDCNNLKPFFQLYLKSLLGFFRIKGLFIGFAIGGAILFIFQYSRRFFP